MERATVGIDPHAEMGFSSSPYEPARPPVTRLQDVNLADPDLYQFGDPHATWKLLREQAPVFWNEQGALGTEGRGFWAVTRYEDLQRVLRDHEHFSNTRSCFLDVPAEMVGEDAILCLDPPRQRQLRRVTQHLFTPRHMAEWEAQLAGIADRLIDDVIEDGECEFASEIAVKYPIYAVSALLGIPDEDAEGVATVAGKLHSTESPEALSEFNDVGMELFTRMLGQRRADPGPGIVGAILRGETEGAPLTDSEIFAYLWLLFVGGLDSTAHAITGSLLTLFHHPEQMQVLHERDDVWESAVEELLRWTSISQHLKRFALSDAEIAGQKIRKGDYVAVFEPSANRDSAAFPDPFVFDVTRRGNAIATFGHGPHLCLGLHFARLELKMLLKQLIKRMPDIRPAGPTIRGRGFTILISPIHHQPVSFTAGPRVN